MIRLQLDNVSLTFTVRRHKRLSLKEFIIRGMFRKSVNPHLSVHALKDINLRLCDGERLGVIGHNGAGKSTLLKALAGVYPLTHGRRIVNGRISSLFDISLGFEPDASGWENIAYRGYLQGETPATLSSKMQAIAEFSELGEFLDMPVRYYSSGMIVRLGFAIATTINPEILLIDEILSAGDRAFQEKARTRMAQMIDEAHAVVIASHDLKGLPSLCDQVLWMDHGRIRQIGPAEEVVAACLDESSQRESAAA